jgi:CPA1 family monovalent cation:H+ antiporter
MTMLGLLSVLFTAAALFGWLSERVLKVPQTIGSMGLTVFGSVALILLSGVDPALHNWALGVVGQVDLRTLILNGGLGLLLFAGAFLLNLNVLRSEKLPVGMLAIFATVLSTAGVAVMMFYALPVIGLKATWIECMLFGALISPTDPIAVLEMLGRVGVSKQIEAQLAGESLFNDGVGAVLFLAVLGMAEGKTLSIGHTVWMLLAQSGGGLALGVALAWLASEMMSRVDRYQVEILITIALALGGYAVAGTLHVSGPLEAVAAGLALRQFNSKHPHRQISHADLQKFWTLFDEVQNAILFVLLGLEVLAISFTRFSFQAGAAAIVMVSVARVFSVVVVMAAVRLIRPRVQTSLLALSWGGLRGGLSIALALSVPAAAGQRWILATTYLVVVFSVIVQGGTLNGIMRWKASAVGSPLTNRV